MTRRATLKGILKVVDETGHCSSTFKNIARAQIFSYIWAMHVLYRSGVTIDLRWNVVPNATSLELLVGSRCAGEAIQLHPTSYVNVTWTALHDRSDNHLADLILHCNVALILSFHLNYSSENNVTITLLDFDNLARQARTLRFLYLDHARGARASQ